jgi:molybdopterin-dependent oxidoreductase iron-sulfur protein
MPAQKASVCPRDCPDTCSLSVTVEDNRVTAVHGSKASEPVSSSDLPHRQFGRDRAALRPPERRLHPSYSHSANRTG